MVVLLKSKLPNSRFRYFVHDDLMENINLMSVHFCLCWILRLYSSLHFIYLDGMLVQMLPDFAL